MIIFGVDPGTATTGYGVIEKNGLKLIEYGVIKTAAGVPDADRLKSIYDALTSLLLKHKPDVLSVEKVFFSKNVKTAMTVGQSRGVVLLTGSEAGLPVFEYTPNEVKQSISGFGGAGKGQVQEMMKMILKLDEIPKPDDAADALAVAVCHANTNQRLKTL